MNVPFVDVKLQYQENKTEIDQAIAEVVESGTFVLGPQVERFEKSLAAYLKINYVAGVANATDALHLASRALGIGPGDEVIVPANTFVATAVGPMLCGARVILVDMDASTYLIDLKQLESAITSRTKAIFPVHLYGRSCDMDAIMKMAKKHFLFVVEDVAQAIGAFWKGRRTGTFGDIGCFSFYPGKNLGAFGDAGAMSFAADALYQKVRRMRVFGSEKKYHYPDMGFNSRLDSLQAAILDVKLKYLDRSNQKRWDIAKKYCERLKPLEKKGAVKLPDLATSKEHVFHLFAIQVENRPKVMDALLKNGVQTNIHYPIPFYLEEGYKDLGYKKGAFPVTEEACDRILSLPMYPELSNEQIDHVIASLTKALEA